MKPSISIKFIGWTLFATFCIILIIMPFLPNSIVPTIGGARRWIRLPGISISPVEFFKIGFTYFLAWSFSRKIVNHVKNISLISEFKLLMPYFLVFLLVIILVAFLQKDFGQIVIMGIVLFILLIFANRSLKFFATLFTLICFGVIGLIVSAPHRINRIQSWWSMVQDEILAILPDFFDEALRIEKFPEPYQVSNSLHAIKNGGYFGKGLGYGEMKVGWLSDVHTDFVLAGITEEIGLIGLGIIICIYILILTIILAIATKTQNILYQLFTIGIAILLAFSLIINSYGVAGLIPIKGMAVPFLSYGGSSLLAMSIAIGMIMSISRSINTH